MYAFLTSETDARARVVDVLSDEWPLNLKSLFSRVRRDDSLATFARVSQAVRKLRKAGILVENKRTYAISMDWLSRTKKKAVELAAPKTVPKLDFLKLKNQGDSRSVTFSCYAEALYSLLEEAYEDFNDESRTQPVISHWYRGCPSIAIAREHFVPVKRFLTRRPHYVLCRGDSVLDKIMLGFWSEFGSNVKYGMDCAAEVNTMVSEDVLVQFFMTPKLRSALDNVYDHATTDALNLPKLYELVFSKEFPVTAVITKDARLAGQMREETLRYFPEVSKK